MAVQNEEAPVALVVPCYNERGRIDIPRFAAGAAEGNMDILFVDDGSSDGTAAYIEEQTAGSGRLGLLRLEKNGGKAEAVRRGMLEALFRFPRAEWIGFWDADLSSPLAEARRMLQFHELEDGGFDAVWASRVMRAGSTVERTFKRHLFGRLFATAAGELVGVKAYDTQCGAKLFLRGVVKEIVDDPFISRWIFDVELYCRLGHDRILEYPVKEWRDVPGSKVKIVREMFRVGGDLLRIRETYGPERRSGQITKTKRERQDRTNQENPY
jgi:glycosyltransferase involved in cell wall biosynthesis